MAASELGAAPAQQGHAGAALPARLRATMERSFGADFSAVRVATDDPAVAEMGAQAFARREQLHFAPGKFLPGTREGDELIGHELAHVVQQRQGRVARGQAKGGVVADAALEREADEHGARAARGEIVATATCAGPVSGDVAQLKLDAGQASQQLGDRAAVWARVPEKRYYERATIDSVDEEASSAVVTFPQSGRTADVALDDLYALDSDELEAYTRTDAVRDTAVRLVRKLGSGRVASETFNTIGALSGASALGGVSDQNAYYTLGIVGGFGIALGGFGQLARAIACRNNTVRERLAEATAGGLNVLSGALAVVSGFMGRDGHATANTWFGVGSLIAWEAVEALNILQNGQQALDDLASRNLTYTLASVLLSCLKLTGVHLAQLAALGASEPLVIASIVVAGGATVASFLLGVFKLVRMGYHHFTHNRPVAADDDRPADRDDHSRKHELAGPSGMMGGSEADAGATPLRSIVIDLQPPPHDADGGDGGLDCEGKGKERMKPGDK